MIKPIVVAVAVTFAPAAFAQIYLVADKDCGAVTLHATRGTEFPNPGETVGADRVKDSYFYASRRRVALQPAAAAHSLDFNTRVTDDGVAVAAVNFTPTTNGDETRTEHAKAFLRCGPIALWDDWQRSANLGLEIYPQWNGVLTSMKPGDTMRFIAVERVTNKLLRDVPMELYRAGAGRVAKGASDQHGWMDFPFQGPGRYMVTSTYRRPDPEQAAHWLVDSSTLTFEIK